jgi:predicted DNA-binding transcriptional regulator AlpA
VTRQWSAEEVLALPVVVDLVTAGSVCGMGRSAAYEQARAGTFPVPVLRIGCRYRVVTAHIVNLLGLDPAIGERGRTAAMSA